MPRSDPKPSKPPVADSDVGEDVSHDKLFKTVFRAFLKQLVEIVHPEVAAEIDLDQVQILPPEQFADFRKMGHVEPDLVAEARTLGGEPQLVLVHVDTEREFRQTMDERMLRYGFHLILTTGKPVVSIAVFLSGGPTGIKRHKVKVRAGSWVSARFSYLAFGLARSLAEEYVDRPQPLAAALAALMRSETWDRVEQKLRCLGGIGRAEGLDLTRQYVLAKVVETYSTIERERRATLHRGARAGKKRGGARNGCHLGRGAGRERSQRRDSR